MGTKQAAVGAPSPTQVPLDPLTIPKFAHELPIPRTFLPKEIKQNGQVIRHEYTVSVAQTTVQALPPGFPATTVLAYGGLVRPTAAASAFGGDRPEAGGGEAPSPAVAEFEDGPPGEFVRTVPGPLFDNIRGIPSLVRWRNEITTEHFLPVDPTLHWANPTAFEAPTGPFNDAFPVLKFAQALQPVALVTHNHGLVVVPEHDGTAEQWFTAGATPLRGPSFNSRDYLKPNEQPGAHLFYHDHTMGMTRISVYAGMAGTGYVIRDPA
ncbi:MAG TPA: hypothetical protein VFS00_16210, partial [Polyangiaceae bacterium]|nr:hypothetical protein [Polyangiaceae bacterium]